jgi:hypothetical protein
MRDEASIAHMFRMYFILLLIVPAYMPGCYKRTKNMCHRTRRKASNTSMIQTLKFEMLSENNQCNIVAGIVHGA